MIDDVAIGKLIKERREELGITQRQLGDTLEHKITNISICKIEKGMGSTRGNYKMIFERLGIGVEITAKYLDAKGKNVRISIQDTMMIK